jgi:AbiV family abortive infection protein
MENHLMFEKDINGLPARLNIRKLRQLSDYCLTNAQQLQKGADILFNQKMYPPSVFLSVLAMEELGKRELLFRHVFVIDNNDELKKFWEMFRSHRWKLYWAFHKFTFFDIDAWQNRKADLSSLIQKEHQEEMSFVININQFKQLAAYVNVIEGEVVNPRKLYKKHAIPILSLSKQLLDYHIKVEPTDRIIYYCKNAKKQRRKGESLASFIGRLYISEEKTGKDHEARRRPAKDCNGRSKREYQKVS